MNDHCLPSPGMTPGPCYTTPSRLTLNSELLVVVKPDGDVPVCVYVTVGSSSLNPDPSVLSCREDHGAAFTAQAT